MKKIITWLVITLFVLIRLEGFGQYQFTTIPSFSSEMVQYRHPIIIDSNGNLISVFCTHNTGSEIALGKYNNSTWSIIDSTVSDQSLYFKFTTCDNSNNIWQVNYTALIEWQGNIPLLHPFPSFVTQVPTSQILGILADNSDNIWIALTISDTSNTTYASSLWFLKYNTGNFTLYRLIDYDATNQFISTFAENFKQFLTHDNTIIFTGEGSTGDRLVYSFDGNTLISQTALLINQLDPFSFVGLDAYGNLLGLYTYQLSATSYSIWFNAFNDQFNTVYTSDSFVISSSANSPLTNPVDAYNTYWDINADSLRYFNLSTGITGHTILPSYLQLPYSGDVSGFEPNSQTPYFNKAKNTLLLITETTGTSTNPRPNSRFVEFNLDTFYYYLPMQGGPDQTVCANSTVRMAAIGAGTWSAISTNPETIAITDPTSPITTMTGFGIAGTYEFVWHSNKSDTVAITVMTTITPTVSISANTDLIMSGTFYIDTFTATYNNGGTAPTLTWYVDGFNYTFNANGSVFPEYSFELNNGDSIWVVLTSSISCAVPDTLISNKIFITVPIAGATDTVWPGDADANHMVDNNDLLPIGLGYDTSGPARSSVSIVWQADTVSAWSQFFTSYSPAVNFNNADCNGDGTINADDTLAIVQNFGLMYQKANIPAPWRSGLPAIYPKISEDTVTNGDTLSIAIIMGDSSMYASHVYGVAFTLNYDYRVIDTGTAAFAYPVSWLGSVTDKISITHLTQGLGTIQTAVTRIDHTNRSGYGPIAAFVAIVTTDNIDGKDLRYYPFHCDITDVRAIDSAGNAIALNEGADSNTVSFVPLGIASVNDLNASVALYPNPASTYITIASARARVIGIALVNVLGETVRTALYTDTKREHYMDVQGLGSGVYYAVIKTDVGSTIRKVTIAN